MSEERLTIVLRDASSDREIQLHVYEPGREYIQDVKEAASNGLYVAEVRMENINPITTDIIWRR